jgi:hypothetical protein
MCLYINPPMRRITNKLNKKITLKNNADLNKNFFITPSTKNYPYLNRWYGIASLWIPLLKVLFLAL